MADAKFHYVPTGTEKISGREVLRQTEDAINDLSDTLVIVEKTANTAIATANNAKTIAEEAKKTAGNALDKANQAVTTTTQFQKEIEDWGTNITTAMTTASEALEKAKSAKQDASSAVTTANTAETNSAEALRIANEAKGIANTAESNSDTAVATANTALSTAQSAVSTAQSAVTTANSAVSTAQTLVATAYSTRIIDEELSISKVLQISDLVPNGNVKVGDTVVGIDGRIFSIVYMNESAGTVTLGTTWTDLTPSVSYQANQQLTATQQETARNNIGAAGYTDVLETVEQDLTNEQKGWAGYNGGFVSYLAPQVLEEAETIDNVDYPEISTALTDAQKAQARTNIGAAADSNVVHLTGNETITGSKTFSSSVVFQSTGIDVTTVPTADQTAWGFQLKDQNETACSNYGYQLTSEGNARVLLRAYHQGIDSTNTYWADVRLQINKADKTWYPYLSQSNLTLSIPETDASQKIATTNWINSYFLRKSDASSTYLTKSDASSTYATITIAGTKADDSKVVHLAGAETITGAKTFNSSVTAQSTSMDVATVPSADQTFWQTVLQDKNANNITCLGGQISTTSGNVASLLRTYHLGIDSTNNYWADVRCVINKADKTWYAYFSQQNLTFSIPETDASQKIATTNWINTYFVRKTNTQWIEDYLTPILKRLVTANGGKITSSGS